MGIRGLLYKAAKVMGDLEAVKKDKIGRRIGRRAAGKGTGRLFGKFFR